MKRSSTGKREIAHRVASGEEALTMGSDGASVATLSPFREEICRRIAAGEPFAQAYWFSRPGRIKPWPRWARRRGAEIAREPAMVARVKELQAERRALQPAPIEQRLRRLREIWDRDWIEVEATPDTAARAIKVYTELAGDMPEQKTAVHVEGDLMHVLAALKPTLGLPSEYLPTLPTSPTPTPEAPP